MDDNVTGSTSDIIELAVHIPQDLEPLLLNEAVSMAKNNNYIDQVGNEPNELGIDIPEDLEPACWPECCIYKVPKKLRKINETAYTPHHVSIGPLHHGNDTLQAMEKQKLRYFVHFCDRTTKTRVQLKNQIKKHEVKIRHCYEDSFDLSSDEFVKLMLLDSVFIIEFFLRMINHEEDDFILRRDCLTNDVLLDLILLENQVPFFLLEDIYNFAFANSKGNLPVLACLGTFVAEYNTFYELACSCLYSKMYCPGMVGEEASSQKCTHDFSSFLSCFWETKCFSFQNYKQPNQERDFRKLMIKFGKEQPKNFTDMIRKFRSYNPPEPNSKGTIKNRYSATKLHEAGVKFKADPKAWPLNIKFERGILRMPIFLVVDSTECLIRNLMALEQCHYSRQAYICNYFLLLDCLINTEKDVDILIQNGIIINLLGDNQAVAVLVNNLCNQIVRSQDCFSDLGNRLNQHYENFWYRTIAIMRSVYFSNLWRGTGTVAALILLFLTFIQSVYSIMHIF